MREAAAPGAVREPEPRAAEAVLPAVRDRPPGGIRPPVSAASDRAAMPFKQKTAYEKAFTVQKSGALDYKEGDRVRHIKFGEGNVVEIKDGGKDYEVTVCFDKAGIKKMFASFAKLKPV